MICLTLTVSNTTPSNVYYGSVAMGGNIYSSIYPSFAIPSSNGVYVGDILTVQFYSYLSPGTTISYTISDVLTTDLNDAPMSGIFTAPFQSITYNITSGPGKEIKFNISGGNVTKVKIKYVPAKYVIVGGSSSVTSPATPTIAYSIDGNTWIPSSNNGRPISGACYTVAWSPELAIYVAGGVSSYTTIETPTSNDMAWSYDGITWTPITVFGFHNLSTSSTDYALKKTSRIFRGCYKVLWCSAVSKFIAFGKAISNNTLGNTNIKYSSDGKTWTNATYPNGVTDYGYTNAIYNPLTNKIVAVGYNRWAVSSDGISWNIYSNNYSMYDITNAIGVAFLFQPIIH